MTASHADPVGPGLTFNADDDFLGAKASKLPDFSDLDKELQEELEDIDILDTYMHVHI